MAMAHYLTPTPRVFATACATLSQTYLPRFSKPLVEHNSQTARILLLKHRKANRLWRRPSTTDEFPCTQSGNAKRPWRSVASECLLNAEGRRAMGHPDPGRQPGRYARSLDEPKNTTTPPLTRPRSDFIRLGRTAHDRRSGTFTLSLVDFVLQVRRSLYRAARSSSACLQWTWLHVLRNRWHSILWSGLQV